LIFFSPAGVDIDALELAVDLAPIKLEVFDLERLRSWAIQGTDEPTTETDRTRLKLYRAIGAKLVEAVHSDSRVLFGLEWYYVEELVAEALRGICSDVEVIRTPPAQDGGKDVVIRYRVEHNHEVYYVEVKHWNRPIGENIVKAFVDVVIDDNADAGLILATSGFTSTAFAGLTLVAKDRVRGGTAGKTIDMCNAYYRVKSGLWRPISNLRGYLHSGPGVLDA